MIAGLMLLGLAGWIVITTPAAIVENGSQAMERKLQAWNQPQQPAWPQQPQQPAGAMGLQLGLLGFNFAIQVLSIFCWILFAVLFKSRVADKVVDKKGTLKDRHKSSEEDDFHHTICECFDDKWVCIQGLCCPIARMAATNEISGVFGYWPTVGVYCIAQIFCAQCLVPCCLTVYFRHQLKSIMNIKDNILADFVIACCIPGLAICQQGNGVDHESGFEMTGCCEFDWLDGSDSSSNA